MIQSGIINCGVAQMSNVLFDGAGCLEELLRLIAGDTDASWAYERYSQICLNTVPNRDDSEGNVFAYGCGSLMSEDRKSLRARPEQFTVRNLSREQAPITNEIMDAIYDVAAWHGFGVGRVRLMSQKAKTCLSLHRDLDELRYHIPLRTNNRVFFVVADKVVRMPTVGLLYVLSTNEMHTVVNADEAEDRLHLVFETYKDCR